MPISTSDLPEIIDCTTLSLNSVGTGEIERGEDTMVQNKPVTTVAADHLAAVVDPAWEYIQRGEGAVVQQEAVGHVVGIRIRADNLAPIVN